MDMSKAYDRVEWDFLKMCLIKFGFCMDWVLLIMKCIESVQLNLCVSGDKIDSITPGRGLRQGDPFSPYLFILMAEVLSTMIHKSIARGNIQGIRLVKDCPELSHSFFADDSVFFLEADINYCRRLKFLLDQYCAASGQLINFNKSCLYFSRNTCPLLREEIGHVFQVFATDVHL